MKDAVRFLRNGRRASKESKHVTCDKPEYAEAGADHDGGDHFRMDDLPRGQLQEG